MKKANYTKRKNVVVLCVDFPKDRIPERYLFVQDVDMPHPMSKMPRAIIWDDGRVYLVHKVLGIDARHAERCGNAGYRFIVRMGTKNEEKELWLGYDEDWFVEMPAEWSEDAADSIDVIMNWSFWAAGQDLEKLVASMV